MLALHEFLRSGSCELIITNDPEGKHEAMGCAIDNPNDENSKKHSINFGPANFGLSVLTYMRGSSKEIFTVWRH